ncbi:c-type cytochrome [Geobacter pickeringii]|uniref:Cytochrome C n=1 Tax=Geobacter pickeringii TaxID=345632 RepID=A0A0B5B662_9BACT|nr:c-type cytochrome [Geobacter pickeringii]AJE01988.1 cytochrome C [Geobacter pickeringii]
MQRTVTFGLLLTLAASTALAAPAGEKLFREKCAMCHKVKGAGGILGPDLSRIGASVNEKALREQLVNPKKKNPASTMPSFKGLPATELDALVAYLKGLR